MDKRITKVLVALKPWQGGLPVSLYHARFLSERLGARLRLMSCVYDAEIALGLSTGESGALAAQVGLVESERALLGDFAASLRDWGLDAELEVRWGHPAEDVILDEIGRWGAELLVVGTHQAGARPHTRLAQVDWQLMRSCPCPMLLARDPQFSGYEAIMAAVDPLHRHAEPAGLDREILGFAALLAKAAESDLLVGHVHPNPGNYALASAVEVLPGVYYGAENIEAVHRQTVEELAAEFGVRSSQVVLAAGDPALELVELVQRHSVDLIVMGALKRSALHEWLLGSTAERIVADVPCDVLLVKNAG